MSSEQPPLGRQEQSINPYAASRVPDAALEPAEPFAPPTERHYQARLTWANRRALLRSVAPVRVAVVVIVLWWIKNLYEYSGAWIQFFRSQPIVVLYPADLVGLAAWGMFATIGVLSLYLCWLDWRYADSIQRVAGGQTTDMSAWTELHFRTARLACFTAVMQLAMDLVTWIGNRVLPSEPGL